MLSEFNIGILASSEGLGALIGALLIGNISPQRYLSLIFITGVGGFFFGMYLFSYSPNLLIAFISLTCGDHSLIKNMKSLLSKKESNNLVSDAGTLLFEQARLMEGKMPADPAQFSKIMNQFLLKAIPN